MIDGGEHKVTDMDCGTGETRREDGEAGTCSAQHPHVPAKQPMRELSKHGNSPLIPASKPVRELPQPLIPASAGMQSLRKKPGSQPEPDPDRGGERASGHDASLPRHRKSGPLDLRTVGGENRIDPISLGERLGRAGHDIAPPDSPRRRPVPPDRGRALVRGPHPAAS